MSTVAAEQAKNEKLWTPANIVTLVRICLVPVFVVVIISPWPEYLTFWEGAEVAKPWIAALVFILIAATDGLDGYLARSRNEVTDFGKFIDPLADKILIAAALLALIELGVMPSWPALIILAREFIVSGIRMVAASKGVVIAASWYGKAKTVTQIIAVVLFIIKDSVIIAEPLRNPLYWFSWAVMIVALVLTIVSMLDYFVKAKELLGFAPSGKKNEEVEVAAHAEGDEDAASVRELTAEEAASIEPEALDELAAKVLETARSAGLTVGTAESLTGGLIAATLTDIPGSSDVVRGGVVSYAAEVKHEVLGVGNDVIAKRGVVSEETACEMAAGARKTLGCDVAVSVTGIAGPGGEEPGKPVGTVWIGRSGPSMTCATCYHFPGNRSQVRLLTVQAALSFMLEALQAARKAS